jgi:hypothetical protein
LKERFCVSVSGPDWLMRAKTANVSVGLLPQHRTRSRFADSSVPVSAKGDCQKTANRTHLRAPHPVERIEWLSKAAC